MIIDFHSHIWRREWRHETMWDAMADLMAQRLEGASRDGLKNEIFANYLDPSGERHFRQMEETGIDVTVFHPLDYGLGPAGEPAATIEEQNAAHAELVKRYPGKFVAFVGVDPRRPNAVELIKRGVEEWGFKGLKLHPTTGFYPDDESLNPVYEKACELKIPLLIHTGHITPPLDARYAHPARIDAVAGRYPELTIVAAHMAFEWWEELVKVGRRRPNVATDVSGWQPTAIVDESSFCQVLKGVLNGMGAERVLFGTDGLVFGRAMKAGEWIKFIRDLSKGAPGDIMDDRGVESILGLNAQKVLGL